MTSSPSSTAAELPSEGFVSFEEAKATPLAINPPQTHKMTSNHPNNTGSISYFSSFGHALQKLNLAKLIDDLERDQELADDLDFANQELAEEVERHNLVRQAFEECRAETIQHLEEFLNKNPEASYEDWIEELHPENVKPGQKVDHRFYVKDSDHRLFWNERVEEGRQVEARTSI